VRGEVSFIVPGKPIPIASRKFAFNGHQIDTIGDGEDEIFRERDRQRFEIMR
jgi:hypothetical protein